MSQLQSLNAVAVLFARARSVYKTLPQCDVYDEKRNALSYKGNFPVIAHPPCRGWGRLRRFSKHSPEELDLARFAVYQVRRCGGVLEHPAKSTLWPVVGLPTPGERDPYNGFTLPIYQGHIGHRAPKATWLYIVGLEIQELPDLPFELGHPVGRVENMSKAERESTPRDFALWLLNLARSTRPPMSQSAVLVTPRISPMGGKI